jgi:hypothetical protein
MARRLRRDSGGRNAGRSLSFPAFATLRRIASRRYSRKTLDKITDKISNIADYFIEMKKYLRL